MQSQSIQGCNVMIKICNDQNDILQILFFHTLQNEISKYAYDTEYRTVITMRQLQ